MTRPPAKRLREAVGWQVVARPEQMQTSRDRGDMLAWWIQQHGLSLEAFAENANIAPATLHGLRKGRDGGSWGRALEEARQDTVHKILDAMRQLDPELTDEAAIRLFNIPEAFQSRWQTGYSEARERPVRDYFPRTMLNQTWWTGTWRVRVDPNDKKNGQQLVQITDGVFVIAEAELLPVNGHALGRILAIGEPQQLN